MMIDKQLIYELGLSLKYTYEAHTPNNQGVDGSHLWPRLQLLSSGEEVGECDGSIFKHYHAYIFHQKCRHMGLPLCPACMVLDGRRAAALIYQPDNDFDVSQLLSILPRCAMCDLHGLLIPPKNLDNEPNGKRRERVSKHSLIDFSPALALPSSFHMLEQTHTRSSGEDGKGQMLFTHVASSGEYSLNIRFMAAGIGVDTESWKVAIRDEEERIKRYQACLLALRDQLMSPSVALTSTMLPQMTGLEGVITISEIPGRAPLYSSLKNDYKEQLIRMCGNHAKTVVFNDAGSCAEAIDMLINSTAPYIF